jgi:flagellar FliJ protein
MKPFNLSTVLDYRQQLEDTAVIKLTEAQHELVNKQCVLAKTEEEYQNLLQTYKRKQEKGMSIADLLNYENRLVWLKEKKIADSKEVVLAGEKVERKRQIVVSRSRDKKALEQLKTRQDRAWKQYIDKKETAYLDEISVIAHLRKKQNHQI